MFRKRPHIISGGPDWWSLVGVSRSLMDAELRIICFSLLLVSGCVGKRRLQKHLGKPEKWLYPVLPALRPGNNLQYFLFNGRPSVSLFLLWPLPNPQSHEISLCNIPIQQFSINSSWTLWIFSGFGTEVAIHPVLGSRSFRWKETAKIVPMTAKNETTKKDNLHLGTSFRIPENKPKEKMWSLLFMIYGTIFFFVGISLLVFSFFAINEEIKKARRLKINRLNELKDLQKPKF